VEPLIDREGHPLRIWDIFVEEAVWAYLGSGATASCDAVTRC
jgi:hypothetical protein